MSTNGHILIIMTRLPRPGQTKTRLEPALGPDGAAKLQKTLTRRLLARARRLTLGAGVEIQISHTGGTAADMSAWLGDDLVYHQQRGEGLGARMAGAFEHAFGRGARRVVMVGCDCPQVDEKLLEQAFSLLELNDLVLGPATDGGYYLIGLSRPAPDLFNGPAWGTESVFDQTLCIAAGLGLSHETVDRLSDIDRPEDLTLWRELALRDAEKISVIIPALNEAENIDRTIRSAIDEAFEVIVADGGSGDETTALARQAGALAMDALKGRARQMNAGARLAKGGVLLFLHADTLLRPGWAAEVRCILADERNAAGAFSFKLDADSPWLRLTEWGVARRCEYGQMPYGDQGLFLRADDFWDAGGYPDQPIMEDWELIKAMQRRGRIAISPLEAVTSARRWQRGGGIRVWVMNQVVVGAYYLGVNRYRLRNWYDKITK